MCCYASHEMQESWLRKPLTKQGMGRVADKEVLRKLNLTLNKTPGVEDLVTECETGDNGMTLYELSA